MTIALPHNRMLPRLLVTIIIVSLATVSLAADSDQTCAAGSTPGECIAPPQATKGDGAFMTAAAAAAVTTPAIETRSYPECGLYLAESTITGAGVGIFTAVETQPSDILGSGDVCLPNIE